MVVLDASAAVALLLDRPVAQRFMNLMYEGERMIAPELYLAEVAHVFSKYARGNMMSADETVRYAERARDLVDELVPMSELVTEVVSEGLRLQHSSYDLFYFVLARRNAATLYTLDRKLQDLCIRNGLNCLCELNAGDSEPWTVRAEQETPSNPRTYTREDPERMVL